VTVARRSRAVNPLRPSDDRLRGLPLDERQLLRAGAELAAENGSFGVDDLAARVGADFDDVLVALGRLRRENLVRETGHGQGGDQRYAVSIDGLQRLED
jgi:hypothetical protein